MTVKIGRMCKIHPTAKLEAEELTIGDFTQIGENVRIHGADVEIGREAWITTSVIIGGGRAELGSFKCGDFLHLGMRSMINIADKVTLGDEVGIGIDSKFFTHGAHLSQYDGFPYDVGPITVGNRVWIPNAIILPNVTIGDDVVIGAMSLVHRDIPSGCLAVGMPARIIEKQLPRYISVEDKAQVLRDIAHEAVGIEVRMVGKTLVVDDNTFFMPESREIEGPANKRTDTVKNLFRRHGIRFKYYNNGEEYREWD